VTQESYWVLAGSRKGASISRPWKKLFIRLRACSRVTVRRTALIVFFELLRVSRSGSRAIDPFLKLTSKQAARLPFWLISAS
jgi:hypothetical protein